MSDLGIAVILDGLPIVDQNQSSILSRFILRKLRDTRPDDRTKILMPTDGQQMGLGFCIVRFPTTALAEAAIERLNGIHLDSAHQITVENVEVSRRYRRAEEKNVLDGEQLSRISLLDIGTNYGCPWLYIRVPDL
ncbi:hypothetical protein BGW36DRAFT_375524 [Talaromyces proteolyticus]|uniref:RRM domain-containing protein n=1 Tax=Talaromyces proteolyticus TaxID=1131652 RepID=A0AAD4L056_9EURO|nr:uncharacterized protein BGW36DRAFT_375524 [Talaromyces proteolyticus]KAH8701070.1 hypothetical protein BGW36DRAFT_375524 [Talaromyces proteolyticus]